jgi:hypothetical protein
MVRCGSCFSTTQKGSGPLSEADASLSLSSNAIAAGEDEVRLKRRQRLKRKIETQN